MFDFVIEAVFVMLAFTCVPVTLVILSWIAEALWRIPRAPVCLYDFSEWVDRTAPPMLATGVVAGLAYTAGLVFVRFALPPGAPGWFAMGAAVSVALPVWEWAKTQ